MKLNPLIVLVMKKKVNMGRGLIVSVAIMLIIKNIEKTIEKNTILIFEITTRRIKKN